MHHPSKCCFLLDWQRSPEFPYYYLQLAYVWLKAVSWYSTRRSSNYSLL